MKSSKLKIIFGIAFLALVLSSGGFIFFSQDNKSDIKPLNYDHVSTHNQMLC